MADRFYGYQYGTSPRKLSSEYNPYKSRYSKENEPVITQNNNRTNKRNKNVVEANERTRNDKTEKKQVGNKIDDSYDKMLNTNFNFSRVSVKVKLKIVMFLIAGFSVLFAVSYQNSLINESFNKKEQLKKEMEALSKTNQQIEVNIENNLNLNNIEQAAKEKLGMNKLSNEQKIYVSLPKQDYVAPATEQIVMEEDLNFFEKIFRAFSR